ncbi:ATP-binding protein [Streptomyces sp. PKU-EA00015]|nr:ATP-binding protein [Streptomyces sp. PKU-EA00015]
MPITAVPAPIPFTHPWEYELRFPRDPRGPGIARATLRTILAAHGLDELTDRAVLLACELATNSIRYTPGPASVRLRWEHPVLRVSVTDPSPVFPVQLAPPGPEADGGRGLLILDLVADHWGGCCLDETLFGEGGKVIWFELRLDPGPPTPATATLVA